MNTGLIDTLETAFHPTAIAVVGASETPVSFGYHFMRHLLDYGYPGHIYPVNPDKETILGVKAYPELSSIPETVDYVICCLPAPKVLDLLPQCRSREVKVVHLLAARLSETGRQEAKDLEAKILQVARSLNIRLIGPNCMGLYYPRGGLAHSYDLPKEPGTIGCVFQSGGSSALLVRYGELRGLRFSKVISYGNALDLDESDFLYYLAHDDETKIIAAYFEGVKDGRKFLKALSDAASVKPVIAIKGGQGVAGAKAAASHTAAIAGSAAIWETVFKKAGVIPAQDLSEVVDLLVAFCFLPTITGNRVGIVSAGGGLTVMAADVCEEAGLAVPPLPNDLREELRIKAPEIWDWLGNPIDGSAVATVSTGFPETVMEITRMMASSPSFDFIIAEYTDDNPFQQEVWSSVAKIQTEAFINLSRDKLKPLISVVSSGVVNPNGSSHRRWNMLAEQQARLVDAHIATFSTVAEAAKAIRKFIDYCRAKAQA
jgi:acyl-CoA synthetase (NDP forming)